MFSSRLDADRFFARIRSFDLECPHCGTVSVVHPHTARSVYNRHLARFRCPSCELVYAVGLILFPVSHAVSPQQTPPDWIPNTREACQLRALAGRLTTTRRIGWKDPHNVVMRPECTCRLDGRALLVAPGCPLHGLGTARPGRS